MPAKSETRRGRSYRLVNAEPFDRSFQLRQQLRDSIRLRRMTGKADGVRALEKFPHDHARLAGALGGHSSCASTSSRTRLCCTGGVRAGPRLRGSHRRPRRQILPAGARAQQCARGAGASAPPGVPAAVARPRDARRGNRCAGDAKPKQSTSASQAHFTIQKSGMPPRGLVSPSAPPAARSIREAGEDRFICGCNGGLGWGAAVCRWHFGRGRRRGRAFHCHGDGRNREIDVFFFLGVEIAEGNRGHRVRIAVFAADAACK